MVDLRKSLRRLILGGLIAMTVASVAEARNPNGRQHHVPVLAAQPVAAPAPVYYQQPVAAAPTYYQQPVAAAPTYYQQPVAAAPTYTVNTVAAAPSYQVVYGAPSASTTVAAAPGTKRVAGIRLTPSLQHLFLADLQALINEEDLTTGSGRGLAISSLREEARVLYAEYLEDGTLTEADLDATEVSYVNQIVDYYIAQRTGGGQRFAPKPPPGPAAVYPHPQPYGPTPVAGPYALPPVAPYAYPAGGYAYPVPAAAPPAAPSYLLVPEASKFPNFRKHQGQNYQAVPLRAPAPAPLVATPVNVLVPVRQKKFGLFNK